MFNSCSVGSHTINPFYGKASLVRGDATVISYPRWGPGTASNSGFSYSCGRPQTTRKVDSKVQSKCAKMPGLKLAKV